MDLKTVEFVLDLSASCTKDQAVMRLLGWGKKTIHQGPQVVPLSINGSIEWEKTKANFLTHSSLEDFLNEVYGDALDAHHQKLTDNTTPDEIYDAIVLTYKNIANAQELIEKARNYLIDIVDELGKGEASALRIDHDTTLKTGIQHITIKSLNTWGNNLYAEKNPKIPSPDLNAENSLSLTEIPNSSLQGEPLLDNVIEIDEIPNDGRRLRKYYSDLSSLYLLAELYAKTKGGEYFSQIEGVCIDKVATDIINFANGQLPPDKDSPGISLPNLKKKIPQGRDFWENLKKEIIREHERSMANKNNKGTFNR